MFDYKKHLLAPLAGSAITLFARLVTAVRGVWDGCEPVARQRVYFANHGSNGDFVLVWTVLPPALRAQTRPVAGSDYWLNTPLKAFVGRDVFRAVLIDRNPETRTLDPVGQMAEALEQGDSLILFPEGTRNTGDDLLLPFKPGLFHLAQKCPDVDLVPTWIDNLTSVMPKGEVIPVPLLCSVTFGEPLRIREGEEKLEFITRAEDALRALGQEVQS
ncbi:lysophospholipid acyltransferase family protein [Halocynthiibacter styelae]|uniref:1-acyl-sn-glycerol-3-phosphate acyltransferase n=1 Tax=Halocynthiibacter styelae TaxID=2761955 RepID=A0A8J7IVW1_9RHOB|nr:lysophospholipid acyltransferase family protein [Paenihalocynthiibacter styelae]MBI1492640.1 1-acyl-sn-glycerol-3-phosphate acyltransferase [Paenihalocynthiibacter styelae]